MHSSVVPSKKIILADSQYLITKSVQLIVEESLQYKVLGTATYFYELENILKQNPDLLITDFSTIDYNGFERLLAIRNSFPGLKILILTNEVDKTELNELNKAGIKQILLKTADKDELLLAIEATLKGRKYYSDEVLDLLLDESSRKDKFEESTVLTATEMEIVRLIAEGLTTKEIASRKTISFHTVMTHRKNIFRKLNVNSSSELIMYAIKAGWIDNIEYYI